MISSLTDPTQTKIAGSFKQHYKEIILMKAFLELAEISILPQARSYLKIRATSFIVLANVKGLIDHHAAIEIGYAIGRGLQILTLEPVSDPKLQPYCRTFEQVFPMWRAFRERYI